jgi:diguanylate cyclase (GGDEF)-like protein
VTGVAGTAGVTGTAGAADGVERGRRGVGVNAAPGPHGRSVGADPGGMNRWLWKAYLTGGVLLTVAYLLLPVGLVQGLVYLLVGLSSTAAIVVGVRMNRPALPAAWLAMAGAQLLWVAADGLFTWYDTVAQVAPSPSPADVVYLSAYPLIVLAFLQLIRCRQRTTDLAGVVDSSIVSIGLALVSWVVLAGPIARATDVALLDRLVGIAYPACDILLLSVLVRLVITAGARTGAFRLLVGACGLLLAADTVYAVLVAEASYDGGLVDGLWLASYVLWGAAALHPSMRKLSEPGGPERPAFTRKRLAALTVAVLLAPVTLVVQLVLGSTPDAWDTWAVALASIALFGLVVLRMQAAIHQVTASRAQRDQLQDALEHQAAHDSLTALANRARVLELVEAGLHRGQRSGALVGLLFVDLDHFKAVNDAHGHRAGDDVLRATAARMRALVRTGDTVGRLGGDEFVVLVESLHSDERGLVELAERLIAGISRPIHADGSDVVIGASIGVAINRDGGTDAAALLHEADAAAYRAKAAGRGRVEVFDDALRRQLHDRADLEAAIRAGLAEGQFALHYQPVVKLGDGTVEGFEALIRWNRPGHGLVPPDVFIPTAEKSTLICHLGRWVLGEATRQFAQWLAERPDTDRGTTVAVNISGRHLASASIVSDVTSALHAAGLRPENLVLEITETVLLDEPAATPHLRALRGLGVGISIDDFGTGYTSIGQLQHLHADTLKIDRSLVGSSATGAAELVELVVRAAHAFGLTVVAEGVERPDQLPALHEAGCDLAQGFLFARPQADMAVVDTLVAAPGAPAGR